MASNSLSHLNQDELEERFRLLLESGYSHAIQDAWFAYAAGFRDGLVEWLSTKADEEGLIMLDVDE